MKLNLRLKPIRELIEAEDSISVLVELGKESNSVFL